MRSLARRLGKERGQALIEGLLALGLVLLVVAFAAEAITYAHARSVAQAAAQDGARTAAAAGPQAGIDRANAVLEAAGGAGAAMHANASVSGNEVTVTVNGQAPHLFAVPMILPSVAASASLPLEQFAANEQATTP
ncbi:MAG: TadE/TadG family type IV pilus assembly protein [Solirubrobacteraceae bacterium]